MSLFSDSMSRQDALNRDLIRATKTGSKGFDSLPKFGIRDTMLPPEFLHLWESRPGTTYDSDDIYAPHCKADSAQG